MVGRVVPVRVPRPLFVGFAVVMAVAMVVIGGQGLAERRMAFGRGDRERLRVMRESPEPRRAADRDRQHEGDQQAQSCERPPGRHCGSPKQPAH
jgi:hypothetical protein